MTTSPLPGIRAAERRIGGEITARRNRLSGDSNYGAGGSRAHEIRGLERDAQHSWCRWATSNLSPNVGAGRLLLFRFPTDDGAGLLHARSSSATRPGRGGPIYQRLRRSKPSPNGYRRGDGQCTSEGAVPHCRSRRQTGRHLHLTTLPAEPGVRAEQSCRCFSHYRIRAAKQHAWNVLAELALPAINSEIAPGTGANRTGLDWNTGRAMRRHQQTSGPQPRGPAGGT